MPTNNWEPDKAKSADQTDPAVPSARVTADVSADGGNGNTGDSVTLPTSPTVPLLSDLLLAPSAKPSLCTFGVQTEEAKGDIIRHSR